MIIDSGLAQVNDHVTRKKSWTHRAIFNLRLHWFCSALSLSQKTRATLFQPIRCKTKINHNLVARVFPRFRQFGCVHFDFSLALQSIFFLLIGCRDYFDFSFTTLCRKAFYTKFQGLNMNKTGNMSLQVNKREKLTNGANISGQVVVLCSSTTLNFLIHPKEVVQLILRDISTTCAQKHVSVSVNHRVVWP